MDASLASPVALLFPGQGAQSIGMGRTAWDQSDAARAIFARAGEALGFPLAGLCFEGPEEELRKTSNQQPAILVCSLAILAAHEEAILAAHEERYGPCDVAASTGHSLGLYTALVAARALSLDDAVRLVARRGALMQQAAEESPGGMAAVLGLDADVVERACAAASYDGIDTDDIVVAANYNAPGQVVISGAIGALDRAVSLLKERGARKVVALAVAGAFHSPLMRSAADAMAAPLRSAAIGDAAYPIYTNTTGRAIQGADEIRLELEQQILAPVRWTDALENMAAFGVTRFVDCGPGATLAALVKRTVAGGEIVKLDRLDRTDHAHER